MQRLCLSINAEKKLYLQAIQEKKEPAEIEIIQQRLTDLEQMISLCLMDDLS